MEHAYSLGNAAQKQALLVELYSTELQLFKDLGTLKERRYIVLALLKIFSGSLFLVSGFSFNIKLNVHTYHTPTYSVL